MIGLNVGSGAVASTAPGQANRWFTYDAMAWPVGIQGDARALPFKDKAVDWVHCSHVIEHVPLGDVHGLLLELRRVMKWSGILYISGPDTGRAQEIESKYWATMSEWDGPTPGWEHKWDCDISGLRSVLLDAGLVPSWTSALPQGWPANTHGWPLDLETRFLCRRDDFTWPKAFPPGAFQVVT